MSDAWERRPGEPVRWYSRFETYRLLGPGRSLEESFRRCAADEGLTGSRPGAAWYEACREWDWPGRAQAWDARAACRLDGA